ncbi:mechanosensitive ion channel family protein [Brenneria sp. 4F2]|nr:mechanosensitive ion channel family protein [Brenneria bubanii]
MHTLLSALLRIFLLTMLAAPAGYAADPATPPAQSEARTKIDIDAELVNLQKQLDGIKQQVSGANSDSKFGALNDTSQQLASRADDLSAAVTPLRAQLQAQLDVLGPAPASDSTINETSEVTRKRNNLNEQKTKMDAQIEQIQALRTSASNLSAQIITLRRNALKTQLALNSGSILGARFWSPIVTPQAEDLRRLSEFQSQLSDAFVASWAPEWRYGSAFFLLIAAALVTVGRRYMEKYLAWAGIHQLPEGRLRRSFLATASVISTVLTIGIAANLLDYTFTRHGQSTERVASFLDTLAQLSVFCSMIAGLGRAFLSNQRPSWRLPAIANPVAEAMNPFPLIAALLILAFGIIEQVTATVGTSVSATIMVNGLSALFLALTVGGIALRSDQVRRQMVHEGAQPEARSTLAGIVHLAVLATAFAVLVSLVIGYISLARFLTYELVWIGMVLSCLYLFSTFIVDICESVFSPNNSSGRRIKNSLNLDDRHLAQATALLSACGKVFLILMAAVALLNGTFGTTTPLELVQKAIEIWGGKGLETLSIVPAHLVNAVLFLLIGVYVLRSSKRWLEDEFLPKTMLDRGIRASLVTLFSNIGYILIILLTLATLGIQWSKLAWIVSALSVGIGFGLQEIVKNFISGLILLTERPVKVGDLVNISGVEGDIRRINVRATEIQLADRSTVIVPNSQFISQNVRNITMGNALGVATLALTFPLDVDPEEVRTILLDAYTQHESILESPAPSVTFSQLTPTGMVLSVTGYVNSPRLVVGAKSDLLFDIIRRLRTSAIPLAVPQRMVLENPIAGLPESIEIEDKP